MITFDFSCGTGHRFEGWFRNREDAEEQLAKRMISCPVCGSEDVSKQPSRVAVHTGRRAAEVQPKAAGEQPQVPVQAFFRALTEFVEKNFDDVGPSFAREARRIHSGEAEARNIRGTMTAAEEESLTDEGVSFLTVPLPKYDA